MYGRYGTDQLNQRLSILAILFFVISIFGPNVFYIFALITWIYLYFRTFSKNVYKRYAENQWYLAREARVRGFFGKKKREFAQKKTHRIFKCPNCKQKIRVPKGRGRIAITCRKCGNEFIKKS